MRHAFLLMLAAVSIAGCAAEAPGQPLPTPTDPGTAPPTSSSGTGEAPPINSPELDLPDFESRVCELLTPEQLAPFAIRAPGKAEDSATGPACAWSPPDTTAGARIDVTILSKVGYGLDGVYARKERWTFFEEAGEVNGYPAVHREATTDGTEGVCGTTVGVQRELVFDVVVFVNVRSSPEYKDACSVSDKVASLVIDTLKGGR